MDTQGTRGAGNSRFALGTVAGVVTGGLLIVGALNLVQPRTATTAVPSASKTASAAPSSVASTSGTPTSGTSTETPTPTPSATPTASAGSPATPPTGTWFALIRWMSKSSFSLSQAQDYATNHSEGGQPLVVIDTDVVTLRGGKTGQWAVGVIGLSDYKSATYACSAMGLEPGSQCGRFEVV